MYYIIYKTTNLINNKIYIGQHITENVNDSYLGSGKSLRNAIKKYGKHNFKKEILYVFDTFEEMDNMEMILVNEEFVKREDTYNEIIGGKSFSNITKNTVLVKTDNGFKRISKYEYDKNIHETNNKNKIIVKTDNGYKQINTTEYHNNKSEYKTLGEGKVTVYDNETNKYLSIPLTDFDSNKHKKVFGGIVVNVDGINKYVSKDEFVNNNMRGINKGKVTVLELSTNKIVQITKEEFDTNKNLYKHMTENILYVKELSTNKMISVSKNEYKQNKHLYEHPTKNMITVVDITKNQYVHIRSDELDSNIHKKLRDIKFKLLDETGNVIIEFFGSKKDFIKKYEIPESLWSCFLNKTKYKSKSGLYEKYNGWFFEIIDWKKDIKRKGSNAP